MLAASVASSSRKSGCLLNSDNVDRDSMGYGNGGYRGGAMLPIFLADLSRNHNKDFVEVMLEIDDDGVFVSGVTPRSNDAGSTYSRSLSATSRIGRKFSWLRSRSSRSEASAAEDPRIASRDARRMRAKLDRTTSGAQHALKGLRFISRTSDSRELWEKVEARFEALAKDGLLSREDFAECIGMVDSKEFALGIFDALARRRGQKIEKITKEEFYEFWMQISDQSFDSRLQIFFDMCVTAFWTPFPEATPHNVPLRLRRVDSNADGKITKEEVQELIILSASANKLSKLKEQAEEYASLIMEELDPENLGYIEVRITPNASRATVSSKIAHENIRDGIAATGQYQHLDWQIWQLEALLLQRDTYMSYSRPLSTASGGGGWTQNIGLKPKNMVRRISGAVRYLIQENWQRAWVLMLWLLAMAGLFAWKFTQYRHKNAFHVMGYCLLTSKGAAETLKLNMALILFPVCRNTLTWLRSTRARFFVPFDDNINFHKIIAVAITIGTLIHAGLHLFCDFPRVSRATPAKFAFIASNFNFEVPTYKSLLRGAEASTGNVLVVLMAISFTLATRRFRKNLVKLPPPFNRLTGFNAFWYSHHLLAVVYVLLVIHGYFIFLVDKWYEKTTWIYVSVPLLLYLGERILRTFRSESYTVKILKASFLYYFGTWRRSSQCSHPNCGRLDRGTEGSIYGAPGLEDSNWKREIRLPRLLVDGPYGAPAQDYRNYDVLLLVGLGIGATPFISILRDLLNNIRMAEEMMEANADTSGSSEESLSSIPSTSTINNSKQQGQRTTNAHFYWVTRESGSFEWFKGVMNEVAQMDQKGVIELHNYLTSVYEERDARSTLLAMVQALNHAKHGVDIVSGTRVRTHFARPNWKDVFAKIATKHSYATVGVFYCGAPGLAKELKRLSHEFSHNTPTRFEFHKEYF
ncbi:hypothetical protein ACLOJK_025824 [Asimina triloba]